VVFEKHTSSGFNIIDSRRCVPNGECSNVPTPSRRSPARFLTNETIGCHNMLRTLDFRFILFYTQGAQIRKGSDVARVRHLRYFRIDELCSIEKMEYANYGGGYFMGRNSLGSDYVSNLSIQLISNLVSLFA
jgi:hypothetical protein